MAEKVAKVGIEREIGYLYFVDNDGDISKVKMAKNGNKGGKAIKVAKVGIEKESGYLYFVDKNGDISRAEMSRNDDYDNVDVDEDENLDIDSTNVKTIQLEKENFLNKKYYQRKLIWLSEKEGNKCCGNSICVLNINDLPDIQFSNGYETVNKLYVGHPYIKEKYMPFEDYELELISDKVREFSEIMQYLGAEKVEIVNVKNTNKDTSMSKEIGVSGAVNCKVFEVGGSYDNKRSDSLEERIKHSVELCQNFVPMKKSVLPLPEYFIWYKHESSWQRIIRQRMNGGLLEHTEKIETMKSKVIDKSESKNIMASLKYLSVGVNGSYLNDIAEKLQNDENVELTIHVKFAPLENLK